MAKLYESTFRAVNIALAFELADACRLDGIDPIEVTDAAATKPFGFLAHDPSAGVGGHGVGVDPHHLISSLSERGRTAPIAEEALRHRRAPPPRRRARARTAERSRSSCATRACSSSAPPTSPASPTAATRRRRRSSRGCSRTACRSNTTTRSCRRCASRRADAGVDPDPRRDESGFGPEDYDLAVLVTIQPGYDYVAAARAAGARLHLSPAHRPPSLSALRWAPASPSLPPRSAGLDPAGGAQPRPHRGRRSARRPRPSVT